MLQPAWNKHFARFLIIRQNHAINSHALKPFTVQCFRLHPLECLPVLGVSGIHYADLCYLKYSYYPQSLYNFQHRME